MTSYFGIYWVAILASAVAGINLSLLGCHLAARDKSMQTLCIGQGATLGVLLGLGIIPFFTASDLALHLGPLVTAFVFSALTFFGAERIAHGKMTSRNSYYTTLFASLLGLGYLISSLFPSLESHLAQVFFGDLATLTNQDAWVLLFLSSVSLALLVIYWRPITNQSFEMAVFGEKFASFRNRRWFLVFNAVALVTLAVSVQFAGFLFTLTALFMPTVLLRSVARSLRVHLILSPLVGFLGTLTGFLVSLSLASLPTVPAISLVILLLGSFLRITARAGATRRA